LTGGPPVGTPDRLALFLAEKPRAHLDRRSPGCFT